MRYLALICVSLAIHLSCSEQPSQTTGVNPQGVSSSSPQDMFDGWRSSPQQDRHKHLSTILGPNWKLNLAKELIDLNESPLSGLNRDQVVDRLGKPDATTRWGVMYEVGYTQEPSIDKKIIGEVVPGLKVRGDTLIIDFAEDDGPVRQIMLSN